MVGTIVHQLTRNLTEEQQQESSFAPYFVDHTAGVYPQAASGTPWSAATMQVMGDPISDLCENLAAEQKARSTYDNILRLSDDPDVNDVIRFLRAREVVHFQRFGEAIEKLREHLDRRNVYLYNPAFLTEGNRVKVSVRFRGREMAHTEIGRELLKKFAEQCAEVATMDKAAKLEGRNMSMFLSPKTGK